MKILSVINIYTIYGEEVDRFKQIANNKFSLKLSTNTELIFERDLNVLDNFHCNHEEHLTVDEILELKKDFSSVVISHRLTTPGGEFIQVIYNKDYPDPDFTAKVTFSNLAEVPQSKLRTLRIICRKDTALLKRTTSFPEFINVPKPKYATKKAMELVMPKEVYETFMVAIEQISNVMQISINIDKLN